VGAGDLHRFGDLDDTINIDAHLVIDVKSQGSEEFGKRS